MSQTAQQPDWVPIGYARFADLSSAVILASASPTAGTAFASLSEEPQHAIISLHTQNCRVRDDGTSPTTTEGELYVVGTGGYKIVVENSPDVIRKFRVIEVTASASMTVRYFA